MDQNIDVNSPTSRPKRRLAPWMTAYAVAAVFSLLLGLWLINLPWSMQERTDNNIGQVTYKYEGHMLVYVTTDKCGSVCDQQTEVVKQVANDLTGKMLVVHHASKFASTQPNADQPKFYFVVCKKTGSRPWSECSNIYSTTLFAPKVGSQSRVELLTAAGMWIGWNDRYLK